MKKKRIFRAFCSLILILGEFISLCLLGYALFKYKGVETFYRIYGIIILLYLLVVIGYFLLKGIRSKISKKFIIPSVISIVFIIVQSAGYYYLNNIFNALNNLSNTSSNTYYSSLVTYDKTLNSYSDLKDFTIGINSDTSDIEGNIIPLETIDKLKLGNNNKIKKYGSTIELLHAVKAGDVKAAFFSSNYNEMFYEIEGFETIETDTKVLYEANKVIETVDTIASAESSLNKPFTMLLIGVDSSKNGVTSGYNADVLLLVTFNPSTLRATVTSVPRDMYVKTACSDGLYRRINTTTWGSTSTCAVETIENMFNVDIDYYAKINFKGIVQLVDAVGGIDVNVPYSFCDQGSNRKFGSSTVYVDKGNQHLNGEQALAFARNRHNVNDGSTIGSLMNKYCPDRNGGTRNDYTRGKNQIKVIMGIAKSAINKLTNPNEAINILNTIKKNFQTNVKASDITQLYNLGKSLLLTNSTTLVNIERMQLKGFYQDIYQAGAITIPYEGSINDIKEAIKVNLGKSNGTEVKKISFDINKLYEDTIVGQGEYTKKYIPTLKNLAGYSVEEIKSLGSNNNITIKFVDIDSNSTVSISSWGEYKFYSQSVKPKNTLVSIKSLTIYVKKSSVPTSIPSSGEDDTDDLE